MNEQEMNELDKEQVNDERLRRMKSLMRQLYKEEFESKQFSMPPIKGKTMIIFVSFLSIIVFGVTTLYNYNRFVNLQEWVRSAQGHVEDALQVRANLFVNLVNLTLNQSNLEREVFGHVAETRTALGDVSKKLVRPDGSAAPPPQEIMAGQGDDIGTALSRLLAIVERYPDIKASTTYQQLMDKLVVMENRIAQRRDEANERIRVFNTLISSFPWYVLARITGFQRYDYYRAMGYNQRVPELTPEIFNQLLPIKAPPKPVASGGGATAP